MYYYFASTYGSSSYNSSTYNGVTSGSSTGAAPGGGLTLTDTGIAIAGIVTLASIILLVAVVIRIWRRPAKQAATVVVETSNDSRQN